MNPPTFKWAIDNIRANGESKGFITIDAVFITPVEEIKVFQIISQDRIQNFESWSGDEIVLAVAIPLGTYLKRVYPYRTGDLQMRLTKQYHDPITLSAASAQIKVTETFKAIIKPDKDNTLEGSSASQQSEEGLNHISIITIEVQLFNRAMHALYSINVSNIYRGTTTDKKGVSLQDVVVGTIATEVMKPLKIPIEDSIKMLDVVDFDNKRKYPQVLIPQETILGKLAATLNKAYGLYASGVGSYILRNTWWIYPLFNINRFNTDERKKLTLYKVPTQEFLHVERTYKDEGSVVHVLAATDASFKDDAGAAFLEHGNGIIIPDANKFIDPKVVGTVGKNDARVDRSKLNTEVVFNTKGSQDPVMRVSSKGITANPYVDYAKTALRSGGIANFTWQNSDPDLLVPGMSVCLYYQEEDQVYTKYGVLLNAHSVSQPRNKTIGNNSFSTNTVLFVFIDSSKHATQ